MSMSLQIICRAARELFLLYSAAALASQTVARVHWEHRADHHVSRLSLYPSVFRRLAWRNASECQEREEFVVASVLHALAVWLWKTDCCVCGSSILHPNHLLSICDPGCRPVCGVSHQPISHFSLRTGEKIHDGEPRGPVRALSLFARFFAPNRLQFHARF